MTLFLISAKDATVEQVPFSDEIRSLIEKTYDSNQVYAVTFNINSTYPSGNLIIYVALDKERVVDKDYMSK